MILTLGLNIVDMLLGDSNNGYKITRSFVFCEVTDTSISDCG